ncbi:LHFPL tetraspan subfamily member 2a protein-like isoform X2 [Palaemon carinicauda]|uniref:LHFPL tetraspan subfamily member 2a protein-like isoform X2 n=1 Tax=Palaemon carinicauda TaxID=392227 RepID=UPI0035B594EE
MCHVVVIVTRWWLTWLLVSVACVMCLLGANLSPSWLISHPPAKTSKAPFTKTDGPTESLIPLPQDELASSSNSPSQEQPSLGLWIRCTQMGRLTKNNLHCGVYATTVPDLPHAHIVALVAIVSATSLTSISCICILLATCIRVVKGANWFNIIGASQAVAGVLSIVGVAVFPLAWGSERVKNMCGEGTDMYKLQHCSVGWAVYMILIASIGLLLSCWMSSVAAHTTTTERVTAEVNKGKNIICLI